MIIQEDDKRIEDAKKLSIKEASAYSLMDGFGLRYITPFANSLGLSNVSIGFLTSIPSLLGNFTQLFSSKAMEKFSRKKIIFLFTLFQSLMWIVLLFLAFAYFKFNLSQNLSSILLISIYTLLILFGSFLGPIWSSWMRDLVHKERGKYFAKRSKIAGIISLICFFVGGFIIDYFNKTNIFIGFIILFALAFIGRFISSLFFLKKYEPKLILEEGYYFSFWEFFKKMWFSNYGKFAIFIASINLTASIASPFFAIYLLNYLQLKTIKSGYTYYTFIMISASIATLISLNFWGNFSDKYGNLKTILITRWYIPFIPFFWFISYLFIGKISFYFIILFLFLQELISGFVWSGFNLATSNFIYDSVRKEKMALCVAYLNILNGFGVFIGATLGGKISSLNFQFLGFPSILIVFLLSFIGRFLIVLILPRKIKEKREGVSQFKSKFGFEFAKRKIKTVSAFRFRNQFTNKQTNPRPTDLG